MAEFDESATVDDVDACQLQHSHQQREQAAAYSSKGRLVSPNAAGAPSASRQQQHTRLRPTGGKVCTVITGVITPPVLSCSIFSHSVNHAVVAL